MDGLLHCRRGSSPTEPPGRPGDPGFTWRKSKGTVLVVLLPTSVASVSPQDLLESCDSPERLRTQQSRYIRGYGFSQERTEIKGSLGRHWGQSPGERRTGSLHCPLLDLGWRSSWHPRPSVPGIPQPRRVGCHFLLQRILPTQALNLHLLYFGWIPYH